MKLLQARYVQLRGNVNIAGRNAGNIDAARDGCVLHLHEETGGVFVTYGVSEQARSDGTAHSSHYIPPMAVESVDLSEALHDATRASVQLIEPNYAPQVAQAELDENNATGERDRYARKLQDDAGTQSASHSLADEVLKEFGDGADAKPNPKPKRIARNAKP